MVHTATRVKPDGASLDADPDEDVNPACDEQAADAAHLDQEEAAIDDPDGEDTAVDDRGGAKRRRRLRLPPHRWAMVVGIAMVIALAALTGWLGWHVYQARQQVDQRTELLQAARQGALNLTTIDWQHADTDVQRILDSATGTFYDDFSKRTQPFIEVIKHSQSKSEGSVLAAGLESASATDARALVALSVKITNAGTAEPIPRLWRMRISVRRADQNQVKVSNVEFVP